MINAIKKQVIILLSIASLTSCATIVHGTRQSIGISSNPTDASVWVDQIYMGNTPIIVDMSRKDNHIVRIELDGYQPYEVIFSRKVSGWVLGNLIFGDIIAIIGKNGRGKSTILKLLASELAPDSGELKCSDNLSIGYFGQTNIDRLHPLNTIEDEIGASNTTLNKTEIKSICGLMMFSGDQASKKTAMLSGGEKSRVLLGKILATPCNLLLLDEPTHHLDMESIEALIDALETFQGAIILVTHSELILRRLAISKIVVCHQGEQDLFQGSYDDFLEKKGWDEKGDPKKAKASKKAGNLSGRS